MTGCCRSSKRSTPESEHQQDRAAAYAALLIDVAPCRVCPSIGGTPVLGWANGPVPARVMFVGEAPGRLGAARTGVPFVGDQSARNLARLLAAAGWSREQVFITNAVLCHPADGAGRNRTPKANEIRQCSGWLARQIAAVDPLVVVALGAVALRALDLIEPHGARLRADVGNPRPWSGRWLVPLYHPSARAAIHRSIGEQEDDFRRLRAFLDGLGVG